MTRILIPSSYGVADFNEFLLFPLIPVLGLSWCNSSASNYFIHSSFSSGLLITWPYHFKRLSWNRNPLLSWDCVNRGQLGLTLTSYSSADLTTFVSHKTPDTFCRISPTCLYAIFSASFHFSTFTSTSFLLKLFI